MEVKSESSVMLSNLEVLMLLRDIQAGHNNYPKPNKHQQNLGTILYETKKYLENTPCALQTEDNVESFMMAVKYTKLTKMEKLQLVNSRPTQIVDLHLIVEESDERFSTDEEMENLLDIVATHLPGPESEEPSDDEENEEEEEEEGVDEKEEEEVEEEYVAI